MATDATAALGAAAAATAAAFTFSTTAAGGDSTPSTTCTTPAPAGTSSLTTLAAGAPAVETETLEAPSLETTIGAVSESQLLSAWPWVHLEEAMPLSPLTTCCLRMYLRSGDARSSALVSLALER